MKRTFIFCTLLFVISAGIALLLSVPEPVAADNGVLFSHTLHNDLADCATCHEADGSEAATDNLLPAPTVCLDCHDAEDVTVYYSLDASADLDTYVLPVSDRRLYFSHKLHANGLEMECAECHVGIVDDVAATMPSMQMCYRCHNNADESAPIVQRAGADALVISATNQCEACHTTLAGLHPEKIGRAHV